MSKLTYDIECGGILRVLILVRLHVIVGGVLDLEGLTTQFGHNKPK